ncbi:MAG TPA: hypothetical protein DCS91_01905 [Microcoleaceae bacterium UBA11344]|nr:hypothetical protein [Microcoleaceae cyanobacterium UBA11344]
MFTAHLSADNPCIIHGYFTAAGHIIVLIGFDNEGFFVQDPYGEWFESGYDTEATGKALHYSYELIIRKCAYDDEFWVHYVS